MALEEEDLNKIRAALASAISPELDLLSERRKTARLIKKSARALPPYNAYAVAFVAADGGNNTVNFGGDSPAHVNFVRIVDSQGRSCAMDAVPSGMEDNFFDAPRNAQMRALCKALGVSSPRDLSKFLRAGDVRNRISAYREITEWAALYHLLAVKDWGSDTMLVREGTLSTLVFDSEIFAALRDALKEASARQLQRGVCVYFVGISKETRLLRQMRLALLLEDAFARAGACYAPVSPAVARRFYAQQTNYFGMGKMFLVKFGDAALDPVWQVDVAEWQAENAAAVERPLGVLAEDAKIGFPIADFPMCVQKAHHHANIGGLELAWLREALADEMSKRMNEADREKMLRSHYLREDLFGGRYGRG